MGFVENQQIVTIDRVEDGGLELALIFRDGANVESIGERFQKGSKGAAGGDFDEDGLAVIIPALDFGKRLGFPDLGFPKNEGDAVALERLQTAAFDLPEKPGLDEAGLYLVFARFFDATETDDGLPDGFSGLPSGSASAGEEVDDTSFNPRPREGAMG